MNKIISFFKSFLGILMFLSFFATGISLFINKDYSFVFFSLFFILLAINVLLNHEKEKGKSQMGFYIIAIFAFFIGIAGGYLAYETLQTYTVYTLTLENKGSAFESHLKSPENVDLNGGKYTFYLDLLYKPIFTRNDFKIDFVNPSGKFSGDVNMDISPTGLSNKRVNSENIRDYFKYNFTGLPGDYYFKLYPKDNSADLFNVLSAKIIIRKYK